MKTVFSISCAACIILMTTLPACTKSEEDVSGAAAIPGTTSVITFSPRMVTANSATISGSVAMDVRGRISETGIVLVSAGNTTYDNNGVAVCVDPTPEGREEKMLSSSVSEGDFYVFLENLVPNSIYRYRAFATNDAGTFYGEEKILVTSYGTVSDTEGNTYQTIKIGEQVWMRENLKSTLYSDSSCINGCYFRKDDPEFGKRYSWYGANHANPGSKAATKEGVCPVGWHLPSDIDWQELLINRGISANQFASKPNGIELIGHNEALIFKEAGNDYWTGNGITNLTGFSALPAEVCSSFGAPPAVSTAFWTSTPNVFYGFREGSEKIVRGFNPNPECGFSVRCLQDR